MNLRMVREVNTGFGDGLATAFEMVATPAIFGFFGYLIDRSLNTAPAFLLVLSLITFGYEVWKLVVKYNTQMEEHQAEAPWARPRPSGGEVDG